MAHKESVQNDELKEYLDGRNFFWNVSSSVGYSCPNKTADVLLVQYLLNRIWEEMRSWGVVGGENLVPDGQFGGKTWARIKEYQKWRTWMAIDGMVSAKADGTFRSTPTQGKVYTIYMLNMDFLDYRPQYFDDIRKDPLLPSVLNNILSGPMPDLV